MAERLLMLVSLIKETFQITPKAIATSHSQQGVIYSCF